jgi:hypothetical protein
MQVDLSTVIVEGIYAGLPAFGMAGRIYFATDTKQTWYDNGTAWVNVTSGTSISSVALAPSAPGNFTVAHGLAAAPSAVSITMTSGGQIWGQSPISDATNLYLAASDVGVTGKAVCFK